ncbi:MAG: hypothetical protein Q8K70_05165 [Bacteroidota bacterium]|nr:hypothetical protein [Bacteroidota bacterium]
MSNLFKNKYRIDTMRLKSYNYSNQGMYFITICTNNRLNYFGEIPVVETPCMASLQRATEMGKIAHDEWFKTIELRPDMNIELGEFIVMPNHIHGIIIIGKNEYNTNPIAVETPCMASENPNDSDEKETPCMASLQQQRGDKNDLPKNQFGPQSKNLASIIRGYKSAVTTYARKNNIEFNWQKGYYEHIIRSSDEFERISNYIINNPQKWIDDMFYSYRDNP